MTTETIDMSLFFEGTEFDPQTFERHADAAHTSFPARERFDALLSEYRERVEQGEGEALKVALGLLILGRFSEALDWFKKTRAGATRHYYAAQAALGLGRFAEARDELREAGRQGWDAFDIDMRLAALHVRTGDLPAAENLVKRHEQAGPDRAEWYFVRGLLADARAEHEAAAAEYEKGLRLDPDHTPALFRCARLYDLCGDDEHALELYNRLTHQPRAYINALLNAAVIYEDIARYDEALSCVRRVLKAYPNHTRARLFLKDVESCRQMVLDDTGDDRVDARMRLLNTPLTEFELSMRARNCLKKMNIRTVGELMRFGEAELLAYKNFGESSLAEVKALLTKKGLRLGQSPDELETPTVEEAAVATKPPSPPGQDALFAKPVADLELSVRSRRCLQRLNVATLGELLQYSEADLLATRNFGVTSLKEIKTRLAEQGLLLSSKKAK